MQQTLSQKIQAKQAELLTARDSLVDLTSKMVDGDEAGREAVKSQTAAHDALAADLDTLMQAEAAVQKSVGRTGANQSAAIVRSGVKAGTGLLAKHAAATFFAQTRGMSLDHTINELFGNDQSTAEAVQYVAKAAQNPAMTTDPSYLGDLLKDSMLDFTDKVYEASILGRLADKSNRFQFEASGKPVHIAYRNNGASVNAQAGWRVEGQAIRVGALAIASEQLTPKRSGVILTATEEMVEASPTSVMALFERSIIGDTSEMIDGLAFSATAATATAPGGIAAGVVVANATGVTVAQIQADIRAAIVAHMTARSSNNLVWVMNPQRALGLRLLLNAVGAPAFPELQNGTFMGYPVMSSNLIGTDKVYLIDTNRVYIALSQPKFMVSREAAIHEESVAALPINDAAGVAAKPVRSLFQSNSLALRAVYSGIDWKALTGSVHVIDKAAW
jgi:HK97 family phage major capsid protein